MSITEVNFSRKKLDRGEWRFFPHIILRSAGFSIDLLNKMSFFETIQLIKDKKKIEDIWKNEIQECIGYLKETNRLYYQQKCKIKRQLDEYTWPTAKGSSYILEKMDDSKQDRLKEILKNLDRINQQLSCTFEKELMVNRGELKKIYLEVEGLQEAVFLSSPNAYENGIKSFLTSEIGKTRINSQRRKERLAAIYLQRLVSKNETASFYGPTNYGTYTMKSGDLEIKTTGGIRRQLFIAYWAVQALAEIIAEDPMIQPYLKPKLSPFIKRNKNELINASNGKRIKLPSAYLKIVHETNGIKTIQDIALSTEQSLDECLKRVLKLKEKRLIILGLDFATSVFEPFEELKKKIVELPNECKTKPKWLNIINEWSFYLMSWRESESFEQRRNILQLFEQSFETHVGRSPRKDEGKHYSDRLIVYEEAQGDVTTCNVGEKIHSEWKKQLIPIFQLLTCRAAIEHQAFTEFANRKYITFEQNPNFLTFALYMQNFKKEAICFVNKKLQEFDLKIAEWMKSYLTQEGKVILTSESVESFCENYPSLDYALFSPDLMILAKDIDAINNGDYQLVLGEVHSGIQIWSVLNTMYPNKTELNEEIYYHLGSNLQTLWLEHVGPRAPGKTFRPELRGGKTVENLGHSIKARNQVLSVADLDLVYENKRFYVVADGKQKVMDLETDVEPLNQIFGLPSVKSFSIQMGNYTPRIEINGVVFQRERWDMNCKDIIEEITYEKAWSLLEWSHQFKEKHRMPRYVYVRGSDEPKPIYIDFYNYFMVEILYQILKRNNSVIFTEMVPDGDSLCFQRDGKKHTSEFRFSVVYEKLNL